MPYFFRALIAVTLAACDGSGTESDSSEPIGGMGGTPGPMGSSGVFAPCSVSASCGLPQFCDLAPGSCNGEGECKSPPAVCSMECPGACGCDGVHYCSACFAWRSGTDVTPGESCEPVAPLYHADLLPGEPRRLWLTKRDTAWNRCIRVMLVEGGTPSPLEVEVTAPWALENIVVTDQAVDCDPLPADTDLPFQPLGEAIVPDGATGEIVLTGPEVPCSVGGNVSLELTGAIWVEGAGSFETSAIQLASCARE